jgi:hypothetical protein
MTMTPFPTADNTAVFERANADGDQLMPQEEPLHIDPAKSSYFYQLVQHDTLTMLRPLLAGRGYHIRWGDGRLTADFQQTPETPWCYVKLAYHLDCYMWHSIYFQVVSKSIGKAFIPTPCLSCFKVVVRPATVAGLMSLWNIQQEFPFACKCGIELRSYTSGLYGGYHYAQGLDQGIEMYKYVRDAVNQAKDLGPETVVILKRGCTEYERACGPSENWASTPQQVELEQRIARVIEHTPNLQPMPPHFVAHVHRKWIEKAYQVGDMTYKRFTGGQPIERPPTTYHHLADPANVPQAIEGGWWLYQGKKYRRADLPAEAIRNEKLRQTGAGLPLLK